MSMFDAFGYGGERSEMQMDLVRQYNAEANEDLQDDPSGDMDDVAAESAMEAQAALEIEREENARDARKEALEDHNDGPRPGVISKVEDIARYLAAGVAKSVVMLTLENETTGARHTYRFERAKARDGQAENDAPVFVSTLTGSNNVEDYTFLGTLWTNGERPQYWHGKRSAIAPDAPSAKGATWLLDRVREGKELPSVMRAWHDGRCARCRRVLTVPSSVATGLGPDCAAKMEEGR